MKKYIGTPNCANVTVHIGKNTVKWNIRILFHKRCSKEILRTFGIEKSSGNFVDFDYLEL